MADPGFPGGDGQDFYRKLHKNEKKLDRGGGGGGCATLVPPLDPPMHASKGGQTQNTKVYYLEIRFYFDVFLRYFPMTGKECHSGNTRRVPMPLTIVKL